ncbi:MAG: hypothetical protein WC505_02835 [Patescibacteria group bacterium]
MLVFPGLPKILGDGSMIILLENKSVVKKSIHIIPKEIMHADKMTMALEFIDMILFKNYDRLSSKNWLLRGIKIEPKRLFIV